MVKLYERNLANAEKNASKEYVWKMTMEDGFLPFKHVSSNFNEKSKKDLKDFKDPFEFSGDYVTLNITKLDGKDFLKSDSKQKYDLKSTVYCTELNNYV
jgi:hypothetical protein